MNDQEDRTLTSADGSGLHGDARCKYCECLLTPDEDEQHNHGICSACWAEAAAEAASNA